MAGAELLGLGGLSEGDAAAVQAFGPYIVPVELCRVLAERASLKARPAGARRAPAPNMQLNVMMDVLEWNPK